MRSGQFLEYQILGVIGILVLVHHYEIEAGCYLGAGLLVVAEEDVHIHQDIVEVHDSIGLELLLIELIDLPEERLLAVQVGLLDFGVGAVGIYRKKPVLREGDAGKDLAGLIDLFVKIQLLDAGLDCALGIRPVIYRKSAGITYAGGIVAKETDEYGVEGPHNHTAGSLAADQQRNPLFHLFCCLLGKSQRQDPRRVHAHCQDISNPAGKYFGFTRARTRHDQHRAVHTFYRFTLPGIQPGNNRFKSFLLFHIRGTKLRKF